MVYPGVTMLTRMPSGPTSFAIVYEATIIARFVELYAVCFSSIDVAASELI